MSSSHLILLYLQLPMSCYYITFCPSIYLYTSPWNNSVLLGSNLSSLAITHWCAQESTVTFTTARAFECWPISASGDLDHSALMHYRSSSPMIEITVTLLTWCSAIDTHIYHPHINLKLMHAHIRTISFLCSSPGADTVDRLIRLAAWLPWLGTPEWQSWEKEACRPYYM